MRCDKIEDFIDEKLNEWTTNLVPEKSIINIFEGIKNIPYAVISDPLDYRGCLIDILTQNKGSCSSKHFLLGKMYERLSIPIKYTTYPFYWSDLDVAYPSHIRNLAEEIPLNYHLACKANVSGRYILIDATWDPPLKRVGFRVNENWNGSNDTLNAVKPLEEIIHENIKERIEYVKKEMKSIASSTNKRFYNELNKWLGELREEKHKY